MDERRLQLKIGSPIIARDGNCGRVKRLIIDPYQEKVVGLVIKPDFLSKSGVTVPFEQVEEAAENEVRLRLDCQQVFSLPKYQEDATLLLGEEHYFIESDGIIDHGPAGTEVLRAPNSYAHGLRENQPGQGERIRTACNFNAGYQIICRGQYVGPMQLLLLDPCGKITGFVLRTVSQPHRDLVVPIHWIQVVEHKNVHLSKEQQELEWLDEYVTDEVLAKKNLLSMLPLPGRLLPWSKNSGK